MSSLFLSQEDAHTISEDCYCRAHPDECVAEHEWYWLGGLSGCIGSLIVIISYLFTPKLRYHPAILIFYRSIFDFALGASFLILEYLDVEDLDCDNGCAFMGNVNLFLFLCSIGYVLSIPISAVIHDDFFSNIFLLPLSAITSEPVAFCSVDPMWRCYSIFTNPSKIHSLCPRLKISDSPLGLSSAVPYPCR